MAKITKSANAPAGTIRVTSAAGDFSVSDGGSYETSNRALLADITSSKFLTIEYDQAETAPAEEATGDPNDPHVNPAADHLSSVASSEAVAAAAANEKAIKEVVDPIEEVTTPNPTVAEGLAAEFATLGVDTPPVAPTEKVKAEPPTETPPTEETKTEPPAETPAEAPAAPAEGEQH